MQRIRGARSFEPTPGPGSYDPRKPSSTVERMAGSAAFRSKSDSARPASYLRDMGDPGAYKVQSHTVASRSSKTGSFNSSVRAGAGAFGSATERGEWSNPAGRSTPAAIYETRPQWLDAQARKGKMSAGFLTGTKRSTYLDLNLDTPIWSKYRPEDSRTKLETRKGGESMFRSRSDRFASVETVSPGPGGHVPNNHTLARAARERLRDFRSRTSTREDLFMTPRVRVMNGSIRV